MFTLGNINVRKNEPIQDKQLDLIIIPHSDLVKLDLLKTTNWQMITNLTSITDEEDTQYSLSEIKKYFGKEFHAK